MVSRTLALYLILALLLRTTAIAQDSKLSLFWSGKKTVQCTTLVEIFLRELRSFAEDLPIEIDEGDLVTSASQNELRCASATLLELKTKTGAASSGQLYVFHFLEKAQSFSAEDWLELQKNYLAHKPATTPDLVPNTLQQKPNPYSFTDAPQTLSTAASPWYENRWLWLGIGAALGTGAVFFIQQTQGQHLMLNAVK